MYDFSIFNNVFLCNFAPMNNHINIKAMMVGILMPFSISIHAQPIMGWSSWNTYRVNINEALIRSQADAIVRLGLRDVGYQYINIDDGYFGFRDSTGLMHTHPQRFPDGLKGTADYIHSLGLKAGCYSDAGYVTCGSIYDHDKNGVGAGLYGHEEIDADLYFNQWGFDFIKIDYCGAGTELNLDEHQRYAEIIRTIQETAHHPVKINVCRWAYPGTWVSQLASSWRISPDISPRWKSVVRNIEKNLYLSAYADRLHHNDMDMLEIGRGLTRNEEEVHFGMWCMMNSPLLIGCDLNKIPAASLALLKNKELIAINQDTLGIQASVVQHHGNGYVLVKDILQRHGHTRAVALYNPSDSVCHFQIPLQELEFEGKVRLRDLVLGKNIGYIKDSLVKELAPHSALFLRMEGTRRLEARRYEAEQAYLPRYNDLGKEKKAVMYQEMKDASGGMVVANLGGSAHNEAIWKEVYSQKGGLYRMTVYYAVSSVVNQLYINVNGIKTQMHVSQNTTGITPLSVDIPLHPGSNTVTMGSDYAWAPYIDCFEIVPVR